MPVTLITASLQPVSGLAKDIVQNNFVFFHPTLTPTPNNTLPFTGPVNNFYQDLGEWYSKSMRRDLGSIQFKLYNISAVLGGGSYGSPVATDTGVLSPVAGNSAEVPSEVALVLTLRAAGWDGQPVETPDGADPGTLPDRPRSRYTGRLYLGPFNTAAVSGTGRPSTFLMDEARQAFADAQADALAQGGSFGVWSRQDATTRAIVACQVDDAFDTQRRRGVAPTERRTTLFQ